MNIGDRGEDDGPLRATIALVAGTWSGRLNLLGAAPAARTRRVNLLRFVSAAAVVAVGFGALAVAEGPGRYTTYAGTSPPYAALTLVGGFALVAAALVLSFTRRPGRIAELAVLAALAWFAQVFVGWQEGPALVWSISMLLSGLWFPLLVHAVLAYPDGRIRSRSTRAFVVAVYAEWAAVAVLLALVRDPYADLHCWSDCYAVNAFLVHSMPSLAGAAQTTGRWFAVGAAAVLVAILAWRLLRGSAPARLSLAPVAGPAILLGGALAAHSIALEQILKEDPTRLAFALSFIATSSALILIGLGLSFAALRTRAQRLAIAQMVGNLGEAPSPGSLESALSTALRDPALRIAYWLPTSRRYVDANGRSVEEPAPAPGRVVTALVHGDQPIAVVSHAGAHPDLEREMGPAVRLGLENERLQAEVLAQLEEIRASRTRIVDTGDAERRRLERDLHDGAQQRLLALAHDIQRARSAAESEGEGDAKAVLAAAVRESRIALSELRELAHGIFPAILADAGLGSALETLADSAPLPVEIREMAQGRLPAAIEMAAYVSVVDAVEDARTRGATHVTVDCVDEDSQVVMTVKDDGSARGNSMVAVADRVGAVGGTLEVMANSLIAVMPYRQGAISPAGRSGQLGPAGGR
jgi:signal transduction histidine kinase